MTLHVQFVTMGMMCLGGVSLGTLFDLYRVLAGQLKVAPWLKAILDLLYWFIGTIVVFLLLYESNWGEIRPFIFLGLGIGICLYFLLFSGLVVRLIRFCIRVIVAAVRIGRRMIELFIIAPVRWLYRLLIVLIGFLTATAIFLYKIMVQLLLPLWKFVLWLTKPLVSRLRFPVPAWMKAPARRVVGWFRRFFP